MPSVFDSIDFDDTAKSVPSPDQGTEKTAFDILRTKTAAGSIDDYMDHPVNFGKTAGGAQVARGITGFFGSLDYAIVDIVMGIMRMIMAKRGDNNLH